MRDSEKELIEDIKEIEASAKTQTQKLQERYWRKHKKDYAGKKIKNAQGELFRVTKEQWRDSDTRVPRVVITCELLTKKGEPLKKAVERLIVVGDIHTSEKYLTIVEEQGHERVKIQGLR